MSRLSIYPSREQLVLISDLARKWGLSFKLTLCLIFERCGVYTFYIPTGKQGTDLSGNAGELIEHVLMLWNLHTGESVLWRNNYNHFWSVPLESFHTETGTMRELERECPALLRRDIEGVRAEYPWLPEEKDILLKPLDPEDSRTLNMISDLKETVVQLKRKISELEKEHLAYIEQKEKEDALNPVHKRNLFRVLRALFRIAGRDNPNERGLQKDIKVTVEELGSKIHLTTVRGIIDEAFDPSHFNQ